MSDLIVLGVILLALNRLDKIDGESYERNRIAYETTDTFADARCCDRNCQNIPESVNALCQDRVSDNGKHCGHKAIIQASPEKPQGRCSRNTGKS